MKYNFIIFLFLLIFPFRFFGQSPERPKKEIPLITDAISKIEKAEGWMLQNNGEWINAQNKIPFKNYAQNKRKGGKYGLGQENFDQINIRSITINDMVYSVMLIYSQVGNYKFPLLEENWVQDDAVTYYVFEESKWNLIFPDSTIFNRPYAVNTEIVCNGKIVDFNKESYLFEIENHIRQAIYQQVNSNTNLIFAAYPVKIKNKTFFRFKFYETINKREIYIQYLLDYNWEKIFRNFYYETDYEAFAQFVSNISTIDPSMIHDPDYYLHFMELGIKKFEDEEYRTALQNFIKASMVNPPDSALISILLWKGKSKFHLRSFYEALEDFEQAIQRTPASINEKNDWVVAHYERGNVYNAMHNYQKACEDWNFALQKGIADAYNKIKKNCHKTSGDMVEGIYIEKSNKLFKRAIKKYNKEKYLKALNLFESAWDNNYLSQNFRIPYYIGLCRFQLKDYVRCIEDFDAASKIEPEQFNAFYDDFTNIFVMRGKAWQQIGYDIPACENWNKAKAMGNATAYDLLAVYCEDYDFENNKLKQKKTISLETAKSYFDAGNYEAALTTLNLVEKNDSTPPGLFFYTYRGNLKHKTGDYAGAIADFTMAIEKGAQANTPYYNEWVNAYFNRGISKYFSGNRKSACSDWQKSIELGLKDLDALEYINKYCKQ